MSKKNLLVASILTGFFMIIAFGVVFAYRQVNAVPEIQVQTESMEIPVALPVPTSTTHTVISPEDASLVAAKFLGQTEVYSVEITTWQEQQAYKVVFSSGEVVYLDLAGQLLGYEAQQPVIVNAPPEISQSQPYSGHDDDHYEDDGFNEYEYDD